MQFKEMLKRWNNGLAKGAVGKFADVVGVSPMTVSRWTKGTSRVDEPMQSKVAEELGVTVQQLMDCFPQRMAASRTAEPRSTDGFYLEDASAAAVPVVGYISSYYFDTCSFESDAYIMEELLVKTHRGKVKALKVVGDILGPALRDGQYALVAIGGICPPGELALVKLDDKYALMYLEVSGQDVTLRTCDNTHKVIRKKTKDLQIIGPVLPDVVTKRAPSPFKK